MVIISISDEQLELAGKLVHQLYQTTRAMSKSINRDLDTTNIYGSEWTIIKTIYTQGTMTQTTLANYLNIEPAAISKTLCQLERKHLISRRCGMDKREKYIYLTDLAEQQYDAWLKVMQQSLKRIFTAVNEEEQLILMRLLGKILNHLNNDM